MTTPSRAGRSGTSIADLAQVQIGAGQPNRPTLYQADGTAWMPAGEPMPVMVPGVEPRITEYQKAELIAKLTPLIAKKAKANQRLSRGRGQKGTPQVANLIRPVETRKELARLAGMKKETLRRAEIIAREAPESGERSPERQLRSF